MQRNDETRGQLIRKHVAKHQWIELKSDYLGTDGYYLDRSTNVVYKVSNFGKGVPEFIPTNDSHILRLNGLLPDDGGISKKRQPTWAEVEGYIREKY